MMFTETSSTVFLAIVIVRRTDIRVYAPIILVYAHSVRSYIIVYVFVFVLSGHIKTCCFCVDRGNHSSKYIMHIDRRRER